MPKYPALVDGAKYRDKKTGHVATIIEAPDVFGRPTHELDTETVEVEWDDGTWETVYLDHFGDPNPRFERVDN